MDNVTKTTVKELIEKLQEFDQDMEVITSIDPEGNGFNPVYLTLVGTSYYDGETCVAVPDDYEDEIECWYDDDEDKPTLEEWIKQQNLRQVVVI